MFLLLLLLPFASARSIQRDGISISITVAPTEAEIKIAHRGTDVKLLTNAEQETFLLTEDNLKKAVETISHQKPTNVFTKAARENHFYELNNWREVKRDFKVKSVKIANLTTSEEVKSDKVYTNNGTEKENVKAKLFDTYFTIISRHLPEGNDRIRAEVRYEVVRPGKKTLDYIFGSAAGSYSLSKETSLFIGTNASAKFDLIPGQSGHFTVSTNVVTTVIKIEYETTLIGDVVARLARYVDKNEGKEFWAYDVNELLRALNMTAVVETHEFVTISYIKDYPVKVVDVATGKDIPYTDLVIPDY